MADTVDPATRSRIMAAVRAKDTKPEMAIRKGLHSLGFRYRLHDRRLPGRPDLVFPGLHAAIFVNGCFWHWHGCRFSMVPATRRAWWRRKLRRNRERDREAVRSLRGAGWRVLTIWECSIRRSAPAAVALAAEWLDPPKRGRKP